MASLFDSLNEMTQQPMFLGGMNLAFGGGPQGMMQGMQMGHGMQKQRREEAEKLRRAQAYQSLFDDPETSKQFGGLTPVLRAAGPEAGLPLAGQYLLKKPGEALEWQKHKLDTEYKRAQINHLKSRSDYINARAEDDPATQFWAGIKRHGYTPQYAPTDEDPAPNVAPPRPSQQSLFPAPIGSQGGLGGMRLPSPMRAGGPKEDDLIIGPPTGGRTGVRSSSDDRMDAMRNDPTLLTDNERAMGITVDQKAKQLRLKYLTDGKPPKVGHIWDLDANGRLIQPMVKDKETKKGDVSPEMVASTVRKLNQAETVLGGSLDKNGTPREDGPWTLTRGLSYATGGRIAPHVFQAMNATQEASMKAILALSGKSFSKFELENDLRLFKPLWTDSDEMSRSKIKSVKDLLTSLQEAKASGLSDDEMRSFYKSALERASGKSSNAPSQRSAPAPAARNPLYNKYGLE